MIYSDQKGGALSPKEMDDNFRQICDRLDMLERQDIPEFPIKEVKVEGDHISFKGEGDVVLGKCKFPVVSPHFRGQWQSNQAYAMNDWVHHQDFLYVCIKAHQVGEFNEDFWQGVK